MKNDRSKQQIVAKQQARCCHHRHTLMHSDKVTTNSKQINFCRKANYVFVTHIWAVQPRGNALSRFTRTEKNTTWNRKETAKYIYGAVYGSAYLLARFPLFNFILNYYFSEYFCVVCSLAVSINFPWKLLCGSEISCHIHRLSTGRWNNFWKSSENPLDASHSKGSN